MPALNAAQTLAATVSAIPRDIVDEIILVDDRLADETLAIARELGVHVVWHPHNVGYGNQKTCYPRRFRSRGRDRGHAPPRRPV